MKRTQKQQELLKDYRKEMKCANQRLRELEKLSENPDYENVLNYAYRVAERDLKSLGMISPNGKVRFKIPTNTNRLESALRKVEKFLEMPTSKKSTIDATYKQNTENFNKNFGTNFTWDELREFTKASNWNELKKEYGSAFLQTTIQSHQKAKGIDIPKEISKISDSSKNVKSDAIISEVSNILEAEGLRFDLLDSASGEYFDYNSDFEEDNPFI